MLGVIQIYAACLGQVIKTFLNVEITYKLKNFNYQSLMEKIVCNIPLGFPKPEVSVIILEKSWIGAFLV